MRKKIIIGNWKMNVTNSEAKNILTRLKENVKTNIIDVVVCPSYISLITALNVLEDNNILVGAQNIHYAIAGAYTGEISVNMLKDIDIQYCIIGHSERRKNFYETPEDINKKIDILLKNNITPIICIGEDYTARENDIYMDIIEDDIRKCLNGIDIRNVKNIIIAYEPVWAIGTGMSATTKQIQETCSFMRYIVAKIYGKEVSEKIRIIYGGSVNEELAESFLCCNEIDGLLVGAVSIKPEFINIIKIAEKGVK